MGGLIDRSRRFAPDGRPVATGIAAVADAWACTNPSLGRGITYGLRHAQRLRDVAREHLHDPAAFAHTWDHVTETELRPYYEDVIAENRLRRDEIDALRNDLQPPTVEPRTARFLAAVPHDPDVFRAYLETRTGLATMREVACRPALADRIDQLPIPAPMPLPGPNRTQLLELLADGGADKPHRARPGVDDARRHGNAVPAQPIEDASEGKNAELVRRYFEVVWNRGDVAAVDEFFGDEFTNFGHRGADARALIRAIVAAWRAAFPDLRFEIDEEIVRGDAVVHRVTCTGTHTGTFEHPAVGVLEPSSRSFAVDHMHIHRVRDGRIVQHWGTRNDLALLQQLGAVVAPQTTGSITSSADWQPSPGK
jgi:predicted ester cyclase